MTTITIDRAVVEQALEALEAMNPYPASKEDQRASALAALRAALAQQKDPTDPGRDVDVLREHVRHLERRVRELHAQQDEPQGCATEEDCTKHPWCRIRGECQCKQAEPVERAMQDAVTTGMGIMRGGERIDPSTIYKPIEGVPV